MTDMQEQHVEEKPVAEQEQAPEPEETLRTAVANNYLSHCVNARVVECKQHNADPLFVGSIDAISTLTRQVINAAGEEGMRQQVEALTEGLGLVSINGAPLIQLVMEAAIAKYATNGAAMSVIGNLQGIAVKAMMNSVYESCMKSAHDMVHAAQEPKAKNPMKPSNEKAVPKGKNAPRTDQNKSQK